MLLAKTCLAALAAIQVASCRPVADSSALDIYSRSLAGRATITVDGKPLLGEEESKPEKAEEGAEGEVEVVRLGKVVGVKEGAAKVVNGEGVIVSAGEGSGVKEAAETAAGAAEKAEEAGAVKESEQFKENSGITIDPNRGVTNIGGSLGITKGSDGSQSIGGKSGINIGAPAGAKENAKARNGEAAGPARESKGAGAGEEVAKEEEAEAAEGDAAAEARPSEVEAGKEAEKFKENLGITIDPNRGVTNIGGNLGITTGADGSQSVGGKSGINIGAPAAKKKTKASGAGAAEARR